MDKLQQHANSRVEVDPVSLHVALCQLQLASCAERFENLQSCISACAMYLKLSSASGALALLLKSFPRKRDPQSISEGNPSGTEVN